MGRRLIAYSPDVGLQPHRTALAWKRTGLALFANALVILRPGIQERQALLIGLGIAMALMSGWLAAYGTWRAKLLARHIQPPLAPSSAMFLIAVAACGASVTGLLSMWVA